MKNAKKWIIRYLGGIVYEDLDLDIRKMILQRDFDNTQKRGMHEFLMNGFDAKCDLEGEPLLTNKPTK